MKNNSSENKRYSWQIIGLVIIILFIIYPKKGNNTSTPSTSDKTTPTAISTVTKLEPIVISGTGEKATEKFKLDGPLYKVTTTSDVSVYADLIDTDGENSKIFLILYKGKKEFVDITFHNNYLMNVTLGTSGEKANIPWTIRFDPIQKGEDYNTAYFTGTSSTTTNLFNVQEGLKVVNVQHSGKGRFMVNLYSHSGNKWEGLTGYSGTSGIFEGSKAVKFLTMDYFLDIEADGDWSIEIGN